VPDRAAVASCAWVASVFFFRRLVHQPIIAGNAAQRRRTTALFTRCEAQDANVLIDRIHYAGGISS